MQLCQPIALLLMLSSMAECLSSIRATRTVLVTGSTDGIGLTTAQHLAEKGYNVMLHGRDPSRLDRAHGLARQGMETAEAEAAHATSKSKSRVFALPPADISTLQGCRDLVRHVDSILNDEPDLSLTVLMNNAGVYSEQLRITQDGLEETFAVNVMAPFVITSLLLPSLLREPKSRIVVASSISQCQSIHHWDDLHYNKRPYSSHRSYSESKLFDAMLTMEMADRLTLDGKLGTDQITCNCLDPGTVNTKMLLAGWGPCGINVKDALDETWLCSSDDVDDVTGQYFVYRSAQRASSSAYDKRERDKLWTVLSNVAPDAAAKWQFDWQQSTPDK